MRTTSWLSLSLVAVGIIVLVMPHQPGCGRNKILLKRSASAILTWVAWSRARRGQKPVSG